MHVPEAVLNAQTSQTLAEPLLIKEPGKILFPKYSGAQDSNKRPLVPLGPSGDIPPISSGGILKLSKAELTSNVSEWLCIELCAGSAGLSSALRECGFRVLPVDHNGNRHATKVKCLILDLTSPSADKILTDLLQSGQVLFVHFGPPCGTASRARERPIPASQVAQGAPQPVPLRSAKFPRGLSNLRPNDRAKVTAANIIYDLCLRIVLMCISLGVLFSVENPSNSWLWSIQGWTDLLASKDVSIVDLQLCMFGGQRNKWLRLVCSPGLFEGMRISCDGLHPHLPWGAMRSGNTWQFATAQEAEYPKKFCVDMAFNVLDAAALRGIAPLPGSLAAPGLSDKQNRQLSRAMVGKLVRGRVLPQLVPEFISATEYSSMPSGKQFKLLRQFYRGEGGSQSEIFIVGEYRSPESFMLEGAKAIHPIDLPSAVPDITKVALFNILTLGPCEITRKEASQSCQTTFLASSLTGS